jgi:hypothetical protein
MDPCFGRVRRGLQSDLDPIFAEGHRSLLMVSRTTARRVRPVSVSAESGFWTRARDKIVNSSSEQHFLHGLRPNSNVGELIISLKLSPRSRAQSFEFNPPRATFRLSVELKVVFDFPGMMIQKGIDARNSRSEFPQRREANLACNDPGIQERTRFAGFQSPIAIEEFFR